jgi:hypothetical protein
MATSQERITGTGPTARDRAGGISEVTSEQARQLAGTSLEQVKQAGSSVVDQASGLLDDARGQVRTQLETQGTHLADGLSRLSQQTKALIDGRAEESGPLAGYAETVVSSLDRWAEQVRQRGVYGLADDLQDFARRRPGAFLAGAGALGVVAGRLLRAGAGQAAAGQQQASLRWQEPAGAGGAPQGDLARARRNASPGSYGIEPTPGPESLIDEEEQRTVVLGAVGESSVTERLAPYDDVEDYR